MLYLPVTAIKRCECWDDNITPVEPKFFRHSRTSQTRQRCTHNTSCHEIRRAWACWNYYNPLEQGPSRHRYLQHEFASVDPIGDSILRDTE